MKFSGALAIRLLSTSLLAGAAAAAGSPAFAKCTTTGTTTVCDATPPNPTQGPITGGQVKVLNGSIVEDNNTFAPVIEVSAGGSLTTEAGSLVRSDELSGRAV